MHASTGTKFDLIEIYDISQGKTITLKKKKENCKNYTIFIHPFQPQLLAFFKKKLKKIISPSTTTYISLRIFLFFYFLLSEA